MQSAFPTVVWVVAGVGVVGAVVGLLLSGRTWHEYGKPHLGHDTERLHSTPSSSGTAVVERDTEIRQLLEARNARRRRRGEPEMDVSAEVERQIQELTSS